MSHAKKNCPNKYSKICSNPDIVLYALPSGVVSSYMIVRKEKDGRKRTHVVGEWVTERVSKQTGGIRCIKPQYYEGTYFMDGHS